MKLSKNIKSMFLMNVLLMIVAMWVNDSIAFSASVIIFVILSVSAEMLEAISEAKT